jgi:hypothetical protein
MKPVCVFMIENRGAYAPKKITKHCKSLCMEHGLQFLNWSIISPPANVNSPQRYSLWLYTQLPQMANYVESNGGTHALFMQTDGFITNPEEWTDEFLEYDYIGAPFPILMMEAKRNTFPLSARVGNGGFSLRSATLMREWISPSLLEDMSICRLDYERLTSKGYKFAPVSLALKFSTEMLIHDHDMPEKSFGFHGKWDKRMPLIYNVLQ